MDTLTFNKFFDIAYDEVINDTSLKEIPGNSLMKSKEYYHLICKNKLLKLAFKIKSKPKIINMIKNQILQIERNLRSGDSIKYKKRNKTYDLSKLNDLNYSSLEDFKINNKSLYRYCYSNNLLKNLCDKYGWEYHYHDKIIGYIYYIKITINKNIYYKIGITSNIENRIFSLIEDINNINIKVIKTWKCKTFITAARYEKLLHQKFKDKRNKYLKILKDGNTEIYFEDVLKLDM